MRSTLFKRNTPVIRIYYTFVAFCVSKVLRLRVWKPQNATKVQIQYTHNCVFDLIDDQLLSEIRNAFYREKHGRILRTQTLESWHVHLHE